MKVLCSPHQLQQLLTRVKKAGKTIGFVPTMGALHEGHLSLVRRARRENQMVVVSIFVNPLQFGPREDFRAYPRQTREDQAALRREKVDCLFLPNRRGLYPAGYQTFVEVTELSRRLCGRFRPGHFRGVATVVAKLLHLVMPDRCYFGAKDYQQGVLIEQLVRDLHLPVQIKLLPTVRDRDGLALSSRNAYLTSRERERALAIVRSLAWVKAEVRKGERETARLRRVVLGQLRRQLDRVDYVEFVQPKGLKAVSTIQGRTLVAIAGWVGKTRLIDNAIIHP